MTRRLHSRAPSKNSEGFSNLQDGVSRARGLQIGNDCRHDCAEVLWILQLIEKIYEVDPLTIRIIDFIENREVIKAILKHLGLWFIKLRPAPKAHAPPLLNDSECFYP
jgi:hypothetical protein